MGTWKRDVSLEVVNYRKEDFSRVSCIYCRFKVVPLSQGGTKMSRASVSFDQHCICECFPSTKQFRHHLISHAACKFACSCDFECSVACEFTLSGVKELLFSFLTFYKLILRMMQVIPQNNSWE